MSSLGAKSDHRHITLTMIEDVMQHRALLYDKGADQHYDTISALHKALRGSDPDASLYWLGRMLEAGEDPLYIMRRLIGAGRPFKKRLTWAREIVGTGASPVPAR